jgi:hypothetical protein
MRQMANMQFDMKKMPLGAISPNAVQAAFTLLAQLEAVVKQQPTPQSKLVEMSTRFYTLIPHTAPADHRYFYSIVVVALFNLTLLF